MPHSSLDHQLTARVKSWLRSSKLSQRELSRILKIDPGNLNSWLSGCKSLSAEKLTSLLQLINLSGRQLQERLAVTEVHIEHFMESGKPMRLDMNGGWVPQEGRGGDPDGSTDITGTNKNPARDVPDDDMDEFLAGLAGLHQSIIDKINARQAKAKVNPGPTTEGTRKISDNQTSKTPGPRSSLFTNDTAVLKRRLGLMRRSRKQAEEEVQLRRELADEGQRWFEAKNQ